MTAELRRLAEQADQIVAMRFDVPSSKDVDVRAAILSLLDELDQLRDVILEWARTEDERTDAMEAYVKAYTFDEMDDHKRTGAMPPERERVHAVIRERRVAIDAIHEQARLLQASAQDASEGSHEPLDAVFDDRDRLQESEAPRG